MKTRNDLIVATLKLLNAIAAGQSPEPEDVQEIDAIIDGKITELSRRGLFYSGDPESFDDEYIDPLAIILANTAAPSFGQPRNPDSVIAAENVIKAMAESTYVPGSTLTVDYF